MVMVTGVVEKVAAKPLASGKDAGKLSFSFKLGEKWYGCYTSDPKVAAGDMISFDAKVSGDFTNADVKTIKRVEGGNHGNMDISGNGNGGVPVGPVAGVPVKNTYDQRQAAIQFQASRNAAIAVLSLAQECGAVKLPAKESDKLDALLALVDEITVRYDKATTEACEQPGV